MPCVIPTSAWQQRSCAPWCLSLRMHSLTCSPLVVTYQAVTVLPDQFTCSVEVQEALQKEELYSAPTGAGLAPRLRRCYKIMRKEPSCNARHPCLPIVTDSMPES